MIDKLPVSPCPACGTRLNGHIYVDDTPLDPSPGDSSVCLHCAAFLVFADDLTLRLMTIEEVAELPDETRIEMQRARAFVLE